MNTTNEEPQATDNMELLKQQTGCCGTGCGCHSGGSSGKVRWVISAVVLLVAGVLVVRAMTKTDAVSAQPVAGTFATPVAASAAVPIAASATPPVAVSAAPVQGVPTASPSVTAPEVVTELTMIGAFAELNTVAAKSDAVFVYLLGKGETSGNAATTKAMQAAVRTLEARGTKCAIFTLKADSPDYANLGPQMALPGVLAMVKGKGMNAVSGEITETKLVQSYVAASSAGGCGSGGCAPGAPGCK